MTKLPNMLPTRRSTERSRQKIMAVKRRYLMEVWKRYRFLKKEIDRVNLLIEIARKMQTHGLYSKNTNEGDIAFSAVRLWYTEFGGPCDRYKKFEHWTAWRQKHGYDRDLFLKARRNRQMLRIA